MGHFGFSYIGLIFLLLFIIPNIIFIKFQPKDFFIEKENIFLVCLEKLGQVSATIILLCFSDFNIKPHSISRNIWLIIAFIIIGIYELWWFRYFYGGLCVINFYRPFCFIFLPGATLPIAALLALSVHGRVIWLAIATVIFAIGHIGIHYTHYKHIKKP